MEHTLSAAQEAANEILKRIDGQIKSLNDQMSELDKKQYEHMVLQFASDCHLADENTLELLGYDDELKKCNFKEEKDTIRIKIEEMNYMKDKISTRFQLPDDKQTLKQ